MTYNFELAFSPYLLRLFVQVVKRLWSYIRENSLQDPANKQNIICDEPLRALFNVERINMFQMSKALSRHIWPLNSADGTFFLHKNAIIYQTCINCPMLYRFFLALPFHPHVLYKINGSIFNNYHHQMKSYACDLLLKRNSP